MAGAGGASPAGCRWCQLTALLLLLIRPRGSSAAWSTSFASQSRLAEGFPNPPTSFPGPIPFQPPPAPLPSLGPLPRTPPGAAAGGARGGVDFSALQVDTLSAADCDERDDCREVTPLLSVNKVPLGELRGAGGRDGPTYSSPPTEDPVGREAAGAFFVWLGLPEDTFWVNLHPGEAGRMVHPGLGGTDTGAVLLEADLLMKQTAAALLHPDTELGGRYWETLYGWFGANNGRLCYSFRQWVVPGRVQVVETNDTLHIVEAHLGVAQESAYARERAAGGGGAGGAGGGGGAAAEAEAMMERACEGTEPEVRRYAERLFEKEILPHVAEAVNRAPEYGRLRYAFYWRVVAEWYRRSAPGAAAEWAEGLRKIDLGSWFPPAGGWTPEGLFDRYVRSVTEGEFRLRRRVAVGADVVLRTYFHGGVDWRRVGPLHGARGVHVGRGAEGIGEKPKP